MNPEIPLGIYEKALPSTMAWEERLVTAARLGFDFVEISIDESDMRLARLDWGPKERAALRNAIASTGVPLITMCLSGHRRYPMGSLSEATRQAGRDIMKKAIDFANDTGVRIIQVAGYDVFYEPSSAKTKELFVEGLQQSVSWAGAAGVMLALENVDHSSVDSVSQAMSYVNRFNSPWLQVYPDIGNLAAWGHDVVTELEAGTEHIVAVHIKDTVRGQFRRVPFGEGIVPFVDAFRKLAEMSFHGPMLIEMWTDDSADAAEIVAGALVWVKKRMAEGWGSFR